MLLGVAAVTWSRQKDLIVTAHKADRKVGTCGKAPSYYLDFAAFLVAGIDSMSLNPDSVVSVKQGVCSEPLSNLRGSLQFFFGHADSGDQPHPVRPASDRNVYSSSLDSIGSTQRWNEWSR